MKASVLYFLSILFLCEFSYAQSYEWVKQFEAHGYEIKVYEDHFYIIGSFEGDVMFDSIDVFSNGSNDIYLAKYILDGTVEWVQSAGGDIFDMGLSLTISPDGQYITTFSLMNDATFEDTSFVGSPLYISQFDSSGFLNWVRIFDTLGGGGGNKSSIHSDQNGNIYVTGSVFGLLSTDSLSSSFDSNYFLLKLDQSGQLQWIRGTNKTQSANSVQSGALTIDNRSNVYVTGTIQHQEIKFDSTHTLIPDNTLSAFVCVYDSSGNVLNAFQTKGTEQIFPNAIAVDTKGDIYVTGTFRGNVRFDDITLESTGKTDIFLVKYDKTGKALWAKKAGSTERETAEAIIVDSTGVIHIAGTNSLLATFNQITLNKTGAYVAQYNNDGNVKNVKQIFYSLDNEPIAGGNFYVNGFELLKEDEYLLTGYINSPVQFNGQQMADEGNEQMFVARYLFNNEALNNDYILSSPDQIILSQNFPNPFNPSTQIRYSIPQATEIELTVFNMLGQKVTTLVDAKKTAGWHTATFDASGLSSGIYIYQLHVGDFTSTKKLMLIK